jgi:hypothetical protein
LSPEELQICEAEFASNPNSLENWARLTRHFSFIEISHPRARELGLWMMRTHPDAAFPIWYQLYPALGTLENAGLDYFEVEKIWLAHIAERPYDRIILQNACILLDPNLPAIAEIKQKIRALSREEITKELSGQGKDEELREKLQAMDIEDVKAKIANIASTLRRYSGAAKAERAKRALTLFDSIEDKLRKGRKDDKNRSPDELRYAAECALALGEFKQAKALAEELLVYDKWLYQPDDGRKTHQLAHTLLGRIALATKDMQEVKARLRLLSSPDLRECEFYLAAPGLELVQELIVAGEIEIACAYLDNFPDGLYPLELKTSDIITRVREGKRPSLGAPESSSWAGHGIHLVKYGYKDRANEYLQIARALNTGEGLEEFNLATLEAALNNIQSATSALNRALDAEPTLSKFIPNNKYLKELNSGIVRDGS